MTLTTPTISKHSIVKVPLTREHSSRLNAGLNVRNGAPTRRKKCFLGPFVQESRKMDHLALTRTFLQSAATVAMHYHPPGDTHQPPLIPPFLLAQSLSSKQIVPTDNLRPNFDDDYSKPCKRANLASYITLVVFWSTVILPSKQSS